MTNKEKYADFIKNYNGNNFCNEFIEPKILNGLNCDDINCSRCYMLQALWLDEEYAEPVPEVDWSKVEVDTPILVSDDKKEWTRAHFAAYVGGYVCTFVACKTYWTSYGVQSSHIWKYAKLAEGEQ